MEAQTNDQLLKERAQAVQSVVRDAGSLSEALRYAVDLTVEQGGSTVAAPGLPEEARDALKELCDARAIRVLTEPLRDHIGTIHTGITLADWGIAETATLVMDSTSEDLRIATMLSETHVAILPRSRIRPDASALETELAALMASAPRYMAFISGASRTADIERVLTIGVHGPQELHILILEDERS